MKTFAAIGTAVLFVSLAALVPAFALQEQKEAKQEEEAATRARSAAGQAGGSAENSSRPSSMPRKRTSRSSRQPRPSSMLSKRTSRNSRQPRPSSTPSKRISRSSRQPSRSSMPSSRAATISSPHSTRRHNSMLSRQHGRDTNHETGIQTTTHGSNAAATTAIAFPTTATTATLDQTMGSSSITNLIWLLADTHASSTTDSGSAWLTHGLVIGQTTGTKRTTYMSFTQTMGITCTTRDTQASELQSAYRCRSCPDTRS